MKLNKFILMLSGALATTHVFANPNIICKGQFEDPIFKSFYQTNKQFDQSVLWENYLQSPEEVYPNSNMLNQVLGMLFEQMGASEEQKQQMALPKRDESEIDPVEIEQYQLLLEAKKYYFGDDVAKDHGKAFDLIIDAQDKESWDAYTLMTVVLKHCGSDDPEMSEAAVNLLEDIAEAIGEEEHLTPVWAYLAHAYAYGVGTKVNEEKALKYWKRAWRMYSLQFDAGGFVGYLMGQMAEQKPYLNMHLGDAMNYYKIATRADENNTAAQQAILRLLKTNKKFEDLTYEIELFENQYEAKYDKDPVSAYFTLSELYAQKQWEIYDPKQSIAWLTKAAEAGHDRAQLNLALSYEEGYLVEKDLIKALALYEKHFNGGSLLNGIFLLDRLENGTDHLKPDAVKAKVVREKLEKMYREAGHTGEIPRPDQLRLMSRMY